jgi:hypothetical protein
VVASADKLLTEAGFWADDIHGAVQPRLSARGVSISPHKSLTPTGRVPNRPAQRANEFDPIGGIHVQVTADLLEVSQNPGTLNPTFAFTQRESWARRATWFL